MGQDILGEAKAENARKGSICCPILDNADHKNLEEQERDCCEEKEDKHYVSDQV